MKNKSELNIALVTAPFDGHLKIMSMLARDLIKTYPKATINFVVSGWNNVKMSLQEHEKLMQSGINLQVINSHMDISAAAPMDFTFPRVIQNVDRVIEACKGSDFIIYDFFAVEGYIAGQNLNIPAICSMPAIIGPFDPQNPTFINGLNDNKLDIEFLENKFDLSLQDKIEMVSDGFYIPSQQQNIIWSWPKFIAADNYMDNRASCSENIFIRPEKPESHHDNLAIELQLKKESGKKIIYVSLGTVVTNNLWNHEDSVKEFVNKIFSTIVEAYADNPAFEVVISTGRKIEDFDMLQNIPSNFHVHKSVDQLEVLQQADVFVTHAGGNSVNEAIDAGTPMVAIPFFGDQHLCADHVNKLNIGISFMHDQGDHQNVISTQSGLFDRNSFTKEKLVEAINQVLTDSSYRKNALSVKNRKPITVDQFIRSLYNRKILDWKNGDLLYGSSIDRNKLAEMTLNTNSFRMGNETPFSDLFSDKNGKDILPAIIDQYHDVLKKPYIREHEKSDSKFSSYRNTLIKYENFLRTNPEYLQPIGNLDEISPDNNPSYLETLWQMCLGGINFFTHEKGATIHFVIGSFNDKYSEAPIKEMTWIKDHWDDECIRQHVKFYLMNDGLIKEVDPVQMNWFKGARPTPTFKDAAPFEINLNQTQWNKLQSEIVMTAKNRQAFFYHPESNECIESKIVSQRKPGVAFQTI